MLQGLNIWGVGSVELVLPSVVGGALYTKIVNKDVKKYTKGQNAIKFC